MSSLKPTTVRFVPDEASSADELAIAALHLYAYGTAADLVEPGARVLDVGFGEGYGSQILIEAGADYRGVEVDAEIVEHARARYGPLFETYDGTHISEADGAFDLVLAFQMIAYLDDPQPLLREVRRVLKPEGLALITTPNRAYRLYEGQRPWNRYHAREYLAPELVRGALGDVLRCQGRRDLRRRADRLDRPARADRARKLARLDPLGLRYRLPESLNAPLRRALRRTAQPEVDRSEFALDRIGHSPDAATDGLDLLALARS